MNTQLIKLEDPLHFIGIGGSGMSSLAQLALELGFKVQGTDIKNSQTLTKLKSLGAQIWLNHNEKYLQNAKTVIYSSAIKNDNPELQNAIKLGLKVLHRSDFLKILSQDKKLISIAGTHGKTTTSAMIAHVLKNLGLQPSIIIGGSFITTKDEMYTLKGNGEYFVAELDESDGTLLKFNPHVGVLTNVAYDHMDYFKEFNEIKNIFLSYLSNINNDGYCIVCADNDEAKNLALKLNKPNTILYGFDESSDICLTAYRIMDGKTYFDFKIKDYIYTTYINILGKHNVYNALAAIATGYSLGLNLNLVSECLQTFQGVARRLNLIYKNHDILIFDDYAHNPDKIKSSISAVKESFPNYHIYVLFEPHRYTRLLFLYEQFIKSFVGTYMVYIFPVYTAGESVKEPIKLDKLAYDISKHSFTQTAVVSTESLNFCNTLIHQIKKPAIILSVGAGDIYKVAFKIRDYLNAKIQ